MNYILWLAPKINLHFTTMCLIANEKLLGHDKQTFFKISSFHIRRNIKIMSQKRDQRVKISKWLNLLYLYLNKHVSCSCLKSCPLLVAFYAINMTNLRQIEIVDLKIGPYGKIYIFVIGQLLMHKMDLYDF